jgi:cyclic pyranopterin phosphate synthase
MFDRYQREIHYLRLSVTDLCNLRCRYCMPDGVEKLEREAVLTYEEFLRLAALFAQCGIDTVRVSRWCARTWRSWWQDLKRPRASGGSP